MMRSFTPLLALTSGALAASNCNVKHFEKSKPDVFGIEILEINAAEVKGWADYATSTPTIPPLTMDFKPLDFCNVTVKYHHPGLNDTVRVNVWLPLEEKSWNGRFLGQGGGGWAAGNEGALSGGVGLGYATANTDAGHNIFGDFGKISLDSTDWGLTSPGNVNLHLLQNFGYRTLDELAHIAKAVTEQYYSKKIKHSYWNGCSTGGRQGLVLAQRYPSHFDGILAAAPAINWVTFLVTEYYAHVKMTELKYVPPPCELNAITLMATVACDELDGVKDNLISAPGLCKFDPSTLVGQKFDCAGEQRKFSKEAAEIAKATWTGPIKNGQPVWFGLNPEVLLPGYDPLFTGLANTRCEEGTNKNCKSAPFPISADWIRTWVLKDPSFDLSTINEELFHEILRASKQQYHSLMDSADPDLHRFYQAGGKIISWHGLTDQLIPANGTSNYWRRVKGMNPGVKVEDFYRHFEVPGVAHCFGGMGAFPVTALQSLTEWVEKGKAPEYLEGASVPQPGMDPKDFVSVTRPICPWPKVAAYKGGDLRQAESFKCENGFGDVKKALKMGEEAAAKAAAGAEGAKDEL